MANLAQLPRELVELQLAQLDLLSSLFLPDELSLSSSTHSIIQTLESNPSSNTLSLPLDLVPSCTVRVSLAPPPDALPGRYALELSVALPLAEPTPPPKLHLHQPAWLSRAAHTALREQLQSLPVEEDAMTAVLAALDLLRDCGSRLIARVEQKKASTEAKEEVRVWYWFPSLSTRAKRDDMVNWAPAFGLTGFVLAGKPGLLCLEGEPSSIQAYMGDIKSLSWADIPSFQKKVSERHRVSLDPSQGIARVFEDMVEITDLISKGGGRGNRGEMGEVRDWMEERGLGEDFGLVVGGGDFK